MIPLAEPVTTLTDWLLGAEAFVFGRRLLALGGRRRAARSLGAALLATAVGAFAGGAAHGFAPWLAGTPAQTVLWKVALAAIGATSLLFLWSVSAAALAGRARRLLRAAAVGQLVVYLVWIAGHDEFLWAILDYVPAMAVALVLYGREALRGAPGARSIVGGILLTFVGAAVQASGFALHRHFNHNDLFHVIQMVAVWLLYRGGLELPDRD